MASGLMLHVYSSRYHCWFNPSMNNFSPAVSLDRSFCVMHIGSTVDRLWGYGPCHT